MGQFSCTYLALGDEGLDGGPGLGLGGIGKEVHDDGTLVDSLINLEEVLAGDPAVLDGVVPRLSVLADTNDNIKAIVTEVKALAVTLGAVADEGEGVILEVFLSRESQVSLCQCHQRASVDWGMTHEKLLLGPVRALCRRKRNHISKEHSTATAQLKPKNSPQTSSFEPAKSMVLTPRVCCWAGRAARVAATAAGRAAALMAETKVRLWTAGDAN